MMEWRYDLMSNEVKYGRRSIVIEFDVATALAITVASLVKSKSNALLFLVLHENFHLYIEKITHSVIDCCIDIFSCCFLKFIDR